MAIVFGFHPFSIVSKPIRRLQIRYTQSEVMHNAPLYTNVAFAGMERHRGA